MNDFDGFTVIGYEPSHPNSWYGTYWTNWCLVFREEMGDQVFYQTLKCPSSPSNNVARWWSANPKHCVIKDPHYSYNYAQMSTSGNPNRISKIKHPSGKLSFCDYGHEKIINLYYGYNPAAKVLQRQYLPGGGLCDKGAVKLSNGSDLSGTYLRDFLKGRHVGGTNNVLCVDGHVSNVSGKLLGGEFYININNSKLFKGYFASWKE
jgi:prepilin-type processing-associated H-X9-DG protein